MMTRPSILMLTPYLPYPPVSGGRTRTFNLVRRLSERYQITLVCFGRPEERVFDLEPMRQWCELIVIDRDPSPGTLKAAVLSLTSRRPITMRLYTNPAMRETLATLIRERNFQAIHVESFYMVQNLPANIKLPVLLCEPSVEFMAWRRFARVAKPFYQKPAVALESIKMRVYEPQVWQQVNRVGVMSAFDTELVHRITPQVRTAITPNGVDTDYYQNDSTVRNPDSALYMGDYKYFPNTEAIDYFVRDILPLIRAKCPDFTLTLIGKDVPAAFVELGKKPDSGLKVVGLVDDTRPYLHSTAVFICPQRSGGGTRFKLLEAMASGCPVVSTTLGAEGLEATHEQNILIADTSQTFAEAVLRVLSDQALAVRLGSAARGLIVSRHSWSHSAEQVEAVYRDFIAASS